VRYFRFRCDTCPPPHGGTHVEHGVTFGPNLDHVGRFPICPIDFECPGCGDVLVRKGDLLPEAVAPIAGVPLATPWAPLRWLGSFVTWIYHAIPEAWLPEDRY